MTLLLSHITFCIPYVILALLPKLYGINMSIYEAALDLGACTALKNLNLTNKTATAVDLSKNANLETVTLTAPLAESLKISSAALTSLKATNGKLKTVDVSAAAELKDLDLSHNKISSIDLSKNTNLKSVNLSSNELAELNVKTLANLNSLNVNYNILKAIDLSGNAKLTSLYANYNLLEAIDVSGNTALTTLNINNNAISALDLSKNAALTSFTSFSGNNNCIANVSVAPGFKGHISITGSKIHVVPKDGKFNLADLGIDPAKFNGTNENGVVTVPDYSLSTSYSYTPADNVSISGTLYFYGKCTTNAVKVEDTKATVEWAAVEDYKASSSAYYTVRCRSIDGTDTHSTTVYFTPSKDADNNTVYTAPTSAVLEGLEKGQTYIFSVSAGNGAPANDVVAAVN